MKVSFGLCLLAVVLSVGEASRTYRGALTECKPGECLVKDGLMCKCDEDGTVENAVCLKKIPPMSILDILAYYTDDALLCTCTPGEKFEPNGLVCTCPDDGVLTPANCVPADKRPGTRRRSNQMRSKTYRSVGLYQECEPNSCIVAGGKLCVCGEDGMPDMTKCFPSRAASTRRNGFCSCVPETVFELDTHLCVCPEEGWLNPEEDCTPKRRRFGF